MQTARLPPIAVGDGIGLIFWLLRWVLGRGDMKRDWAASVIANSVIWDKVVWDKLNLTAARTFVSVRYVFR